MGGSGRRRDGRRVAGVLCALVVLLFGAVTPWVVAAANILSPPSAAATEVVSHGAGTHEAAASQAAHCPPKDGGHHEPAAPGTPMCSQCVICTFGAVPTGEAPSLRRAESVAYVVFPSARPAPSLSPRAPPKPPATAPPVLIA